MSDNQFQRETVERLARIEENLRQLGDTLTNIGGYIERIIKVESSNKSAHKRIDDLEELVVTSKKEIYWTAGAIVAAVKFVFFFVEKVGAK